MSTDPAPTLDRRAFVRLGVSAAGGLLLSCHFLPRTTRAAAATATGTTSTIGLFVRIEKDGTTIIGARSPEIGQGVKTSLPMIIAEEMDADWSKVRVEQLPLGIARDADGAFSWKYGPQGAGGSTNIPDAWADLRHAGASVRQVMLAAAAQHWNALVSELRTESGVVLHSDGRSVAYGELAARAAELPLPSEKPPLKDPKHYRILGTRTRVVDTEDIVTGRARYGLDATLPGALTAVVTRCPTFDGELKSFDATAARKIPGVRDVIALPGPKHGEPITANLAPGVAVIADNTWAALQGQRALKIEWTPGPYATESSASLDAQCAQLFKGSGTRARNDGDFDAARAAAAQVVEATYRVPFVAHASLEPQNACVDVRNDSVLIVAPLQMPGGASRIAAQLTGIDRLKIEVRMTRVGGGFGRRLSNDFIAEAVMLSKLIGKPIKLLWTREEDMRHDLFRPFGHHHMIATLDADRQLTGWAHRLASASKYYRRPDVKPEDLWTAELYPDDFPAQLLGNVRMEWFGVDSGILRGSWRAPAHAANAFAVQSFLDEIAHATQQDPLALRLRMLGTARELPYAQHGGPTFNPGRLADVLRLAAQRIGWGRVVPQGRGLGIAGHFTFGGYAAHAMEVSVARDGSYRIERCVCAVDVGRPINRLGLEAQMMGGTIDGISTARTLEINIKEGQVVQSNFSDYPLLRIADAPDVEVAIVDSERDPSGAGEIGLPTAAPALTNAIFAASGRRVRNLPIGARLTV
ncbi:MAG TPA: molybdopterin cofactor-binding domain-containing protein [Steroidobacteraceae bacterium]|nr:molybdopterin cofactor-binding domain-containing protein [Steroidobacteraceae bacterium]